MSALSLSCQILLMFEAQHSPQARARLGGRGGEEVRGGDVALNSLLITCLSLKHPLSCTALKQLECMAKSRVFFLMDFECFSANQEPRRKPP